MVVLMFLSGGCLAPGITYILRDLAVGISLLVVSAYAPY